MKGNWSQFAGLAGVIVFLFGVIGGFVVDFQGAAMVLPSAHIILGAAMVIFWFATYGLSHRQQAGEIVKGRAARFGANAAVYFIIFIGIIVAINWLVARHDKQWDLTEQGVYSIADQSAQVIRNLKAPLKVVAFKTANGPDQERMNDLLKLYKNANPGQFSFEIVDPNAKPHLVDKFGMKTGNFVYIEYGDKDPKAVSRINDLSEEAVTNAILKLTRGDEKKVYYVEGHGEPDLKSKSELEPFAGAIADEHMKIEGITLAERDRIPDDAAAVILNSPRKAVPDRERDMLAKYADEGGRLLMTYDPQVTASSVKDLAAHFGIVIGQDIIVDMVRRLFAGPALGVQPIIPLQGQHPILERFTEGDIAVFNMTSSVTIDQNNADAKKDCKELLKTSPTAWAETNLAALFDTENPTASKDPDDMQGPVPVAVVCEKKLGKDAGSQEGSVNFEKVSRVVVFGDSDWFAGGNLMNYSARDLILNSVNWLAGEEGGVSIRPKQIRFSAAPIEKSKFILIFIASYIIPELILLAGLYVWWRRRSLS